jgi:hypothetical protein
MGSALLAGWRPDSLVRGDLCLPGDVWKAGCFREFIVRGGFGGLAPKLREAFAVAVLDVTLARDTPGLIHPWRTRLRSWMLGLTVAGNGRCRCR